MTACSEKKKIFVPVAENLVCLVSPSPQETQMHYLFNTSQQTGGDRCLPPLRMYIRTGWSDLRQEVLQPDSIWILKVKNFQESTLQLNTRESGGFGETDTYPKDIVD